MKRTEDEDRLDAHGASRRKFLRTAATGAAAAAGIPGAAEAFDFESFFQKHFREMSQRDIEEVTARLARKFEKKYGKPFDVAATGPIDNVVFGYGLDISRCIGCRRCVYACIQV